MAGVRAGINFFAGHKSFENDSVQQGRGSRFVEIAVDDDEVGVVAGSELAFVLLGKLRIGGALSVGVESLAAGELVFREVGFGSGLIFAGDSGIDATKGGNGLHRVVCAEGEGHAGIEEGLPGVRVGGALGTETGFGSVHVGEKVAGLHGGNNTELLEAGDIGGVDDLGVLDAVAGREASQVWVAW